MSIRRDVRCVRGIILICTCVFVLTSAEGQIHVTGSDQPIVASPGDDVLLPCVLEPTSDVSDKTVEWTRPDQPGPKVVVHGYRHRHEEPNTSPLYNGRTKMFPEGLKEGNCSLLIKNVTSAHQGRYRCFIPKLESDSKSTELQLIVGQIHVTGSDQPIIVAPGDDVLLPCVLEPTCDVGRRTVEWTRPDQPHPKVVVHGYRHRHEEPNTSPLYNGRTKMFLEGLKEGNCSLQIKNVTSAHQGRYRCFIPKLESDSKSTELQLIVDPDVTPHHLQNPTPAPPQDSDSNRHVGLVSVAVFLFVVVVVFVVFVCKKNPNVDQNNDVEGGVAEVMVGGDGGGAGA